MIASQGNLGQEWFGSLKVATQSTLATEGENTNTKRQKEIQKQNTRNTNQPEWFGSLKVATQSTLATERKIQIQKYKEKSKNLILEIRINQNELSALR